MTFLPETQPMPIEVRNSLDLPLCRKCGGRCCKGSPGVWVDPERFFAIFFSGQHLTLAQLRERLPALGLVLWEKSGVPIPAPCSLNSGCSFLTADGCLFSVAERPCQCLALVPNKATLLQEQGCLCLEPEAFTRAVAKQLWQNYWNRAT